MPGILVVFAHPDDEAFGPAGTIARYVAQGVPVDLLTFTRGQHGTRQEPLDSPEALGRLREYELRAAAKVLGVRELRLLDYVDGELDRADQAELAGHVQQALAESGADTVLTFGPTGITRHPDHIAVHGAVMEAVANEGNMRVFWAAVPEEFAQQFNVEGPEAEPTHRIDVSDYFDTKLAALACHSSQQDAREFFHMLRERGSTEEFFHRAHPASEPGRSYRDLFEA